MVPIEPPQRPSTKTNHTLNHHAQNSMVQGDQDTLQQVLCFFSRGVCGRVLYKELCEGLVHFSKLCDFEKSLGEDEANMMHMYLQYSHSKLTNHDGAVSLVLRNHCND